MNTDQIISVALRVCIALTLGIVLGRFLLIELRTGRNRNQPLETVRATVYLRHPEMVPALAGRDNAYYYYITFHTQTGESLKLYMNRDAFFNIPEGASGELMWQGEKLWRFTLDDGTEIRQ